MPFVFLFLTLVVAVVAAVAVVVDDVFVVVLVVVMLLVWIFVVVMLGAKRLTQCFTDYERLSFLGITIVCLGLPRVVCLAYLRHRL